MGWWWSRPVLGVSFSQAKQLYLVLIRLLSYSEAATMYHLKGQSLNWPKLKILRNGLFSIARKLYNGRTRLAMGTRKMPPIAVGDKVLVFIIRQEGHRTSGISLVS